MLRPRSGWALARATWWTRIAAPPIGCWSSWKSFLVPRGAKCEALFLLAPPFISTLTCLFRRCAIESLVLQPRHISRAKAAGNRDQRRKSYGRWHGKNADGAGDCREARG